MGMNRSVFMSPYVDYGPIAEAYNLLYSQATFTSQTNLMLTRLLLPNLEAGARILDLCCGTGHLDAKLSGLGFQVTGVDCSNKMLRCARKNSPTSMYICADARRFNLRGIHDAAVCFSDSLHTILDSRDLASVFNNVRSALKEDGFFVFDLTTEFGFENCRRESLTLVRSDAVLVHRFQFDPSKRLGISRVTAFHLEEGKWERSDAPLFERAYSVEELQGALFAAGFRKFELFDAPYSDGTIAKIIVRAWRS